jgi:hypothetical protein
VQANRATPPAVRFRISGFSCHASAEFYKDIVKVIIGNQKRKKKLTKLVFITEEKWGRQYLDTPMPSVYTSYLATTGLDVVVLYVQHAS